MLKVENLTKIFSTPNKKEFVAVNDLSFHINHHEVVALVGESGSGKTTLGRLILRLETPDKGKIYFEGKNILSLKNKKLFPYRKKMQIIFQDPFSSLNPRQKIINVLKEGVLNFSPKISSNSLHKKISHYVKMVGLGENDLNKYPHEFSGGQRQRIAIARALIVEPEFLVCDEIVSALDISIKGTIINLLKKIRTTQKLALLFISHDLNLSTMIADTIMVMYSGKIIEIIPKNKLFGDAKHPYTAFLFNQTMESMDARSNKKGFNNLPSEIEEISPKYLCPYYFRCSRRMDICKNKPLKFYNISNEHKILCHLFEK